jgi:hypothetical protein
MVSSSMWKMYSFAILRMAARSLSRSTLWAATKHCNGVALATETNQPATEGPTNPPWQAPFWRGRELSLNLSRGTANLLSL